MIKINIDGAAIPNPGKMGVGVVINNNGKITEISKYIGYGTNNESEYSACICALKAVSKNKNEKIRIYSDSQLVVNQINDRYEVNSHKIYPYFRKVRRLIKNFKDIKISWIPREENSHADELSNRAVFQSEYEKRLERSKGLKVVCENGKYFVGKYYVNPDVPFCECSDFQIRCCKWGIPCKHIIAVKKFIQDKNGIKI